MTTPLLERLLPRSLDGGYRGHPAALWIFGAVALLKIGIGGGTLFNGREAAVSADGIALASFGATGADAFVSIFAAWGLAQLALGAVNAIVLFRYRALVPFMFVLLLAEHLLRKLIFVVLPIPRIASQTPGLAINIVIVALMLVGLVLALRERQAARRSVPD